MVPLPSSYQKKAAVVGAGPVGCLTAIMLANRGWKVSVYEGRADLRLPSTQATIRQRSINFTISHRGIAALQSVYPEAAERFMNHVSIPMRGRMVHHMDGRLDSQPYDRYGQCINSVDRAFLNADLLEQVCKIRDIEVFFRHKVRSVDFGEKKIFVEDLDQVQECKTVGFDLCIGADGSYSTVRREMMKVVRMDFQQEYIEHEYMELRMPASYNNAFILDSNHLHIWPRHSHMLVAMPNRDKTFTCTLFAPSYLFDSLETPEKFLQWFRSNFPDALEAIGEKNLLRDYSCNPRSALICTKANPYHYKSRGIILGDAAHSMVPFYGQGLNCGLEDVRVLKILFDQEHVQSVTASENTGTEDERLAKALARFSEERHKDLMAITDLAMGNYIELRHLVTTPMYLFRKYLDGWLHSLSPAKPLAVLNELLGSELYDKNEPKYWHWLPLYTMVAFRPDISYNDVRRKALWQANVLAWVGCLGAIMLTLICMWIFQMV